MPLSTRSTNASAPPTPAPTFAPIEGPEALGLGTFVDGVVEQSGPRKHPRVVVRKAGDVSADVDVSVVSDDSMIDEVGVVGRLPKVWDVAMLASWVR